MLLKNLPMSLTETKNIAKIIKRSFFMIDKQNKIKHNISTEIISLSQEKILSRHSRLSSATAKGLIIRSKKFFSTKKDIYKFLNQPVQLFLSQYELSLYGVIAKIQPLEGDMFDIHVDFTESVPLYYRECVADLLN